MILVDTSVKIDYFRKQNKEKTILFELFSQKEDLAISVITKYELMIGSNKQQDSFWNTLLDSFTIFSLDEAIADETILIKKELKAQNNEIGLADMIIAATARFNKIKLITLNYNHFKKVTNLKVD